MSDIDTIREALRFNFREDLDADESAQVERALALLDGAVGLVRKGDVLLSAERDRLLVDRLYCARHHPQDDRREEACDQAIALLSVGRQEKP